MVLPLDGSATPVVVVGGCGVWTYDLGMTATPDDPLPVVHRRKTGWDARWRLGSWGPRSWAWPILVRAHCSKLRDSCITKRNGHGSHQWTAGGAEDGLRSRASNP